MRYLFAAVIAVLVIAADFESSDVRSVWTEPSFVVAQAQSEPATTSNNQTGTVTASVEYSPGLDVTNVVPAPYEAATAADAAAHAAASIHDESSSAELICEAVRAAAEENEIPIGFLCACCGRKAGFALRRDQLGRRAGHCAIHAANGGRNGIAGPVRSAAGDPCVGEISSQASQSVRKSWACGGGLQCGRRQDREVAFTTQFIACGNARLRQDHHRPQGRGVDRRREYCLHADRPATESAMRGRRRPVAARPDRRGQCRPDAFRQRAVAQSGD